MNHDISYYSDGNLKVEFCTICGCDDTVQLLKADCPGEKATKLPDWWIKKVDKDTEPK